MSQKLYMPIVQDALKLRAKIKACKTSIASDKARMELRRTLKVMNAKAYGEYLLAIQQEVA